MAKPRKAIITCAITGSIHTPSMSPHLPVTAEEITASAVAAAEAGAAVIHLHARNEQDGRPDQTPEAFARFLPRIKQATDAVLNLTSGGSPFMSLDDRLKPGTTFRPELCSLNMGSMNFGFFPMLDRFTEFKHDWERDHLQGSKSVVFKNSYADIEYAITTLGEGGAKFEFECYDISHLYNLAYFADKGIAKPPFLVQSIFGLMGGIGGHPEDVMHMKRTADRLFGTDYEWSVLGAGRNQIPVATQAAAMGAHVRVGLEDSLWIGPGEMATSNAQQVAKVRGILENLGCSVATPAEAREILGLKGGDQVNF